MTVDDRSLDTDEAAESKPEKATSSEHSHKSKVELGRTAIGLQTQGQRNPRVEALKRLNAEWEKTNVKTRAQHESQQHLMAAARRRPIAHPSQEGLKNNGHSSGSDSDQRPSSPTNPSHFHKTTKEPERRSDPLTPRKHVRILEDHHGMQRSQRDRKLQDSPQSFHRLTALQDPRSSIEEQASPTRRRSRPSQGTAKSSQPLRDSMEEVKSSRKIPNSLWNHAHDTRPAIRFIDKDRFKDDIEHFGTKEHSFFHSDQRLNKEISRFAAHLLDERLIAWQQVKDVEKRLETEKAKRVQDHDRIQKLEALIDHRKLIQTGIEDQYRDIGEPNSSRILRDRI